MLFGYVLKHYDANEEPDFIGWQIVSRSNLMGEREVARSVGRYQTCFQAQEACKAHASATNLTIKMSAPFTEDDPNGEKVVGIVGQRNAI